MKLDTKSRRLRKTAVASIAISLFCAGEIATSHAQSIEEIVVQARKRDEGILDVPVAITAVSAAEIERLAVTDIRDLAIYSPGLFIQTSTSGGGGSVALRGINTSETNVGFEQSVSIAVDNVQTGRPRALNLALVDLEQVDILRGPQALFFGKNSPGGVIDFKTANPTRETEAYITARYELEAQEVQVTAALSGALSDNWAGRLAVFRSESDGFLENAVTQEIANAASQQVGPAGAPLFAVTGGAPVDVPTEFPSESSVARVSLEYDNEQSGVNALFKATVSDSTTIGSGVGRQCVRGTGPGGNQSDYLGLIDAINECELNDVTRVGALSQAVIDSLGAHQTPQTEVEMTLLSATISKDLGDYELTSVTGYFDLDSFADGIFDYTSFAQVPGVETETYESFSQELRLSSKFDSALNFSVGAFYQDVEQRFENTLILIAFGPSPTNGSFANWRKPGTVDADTFSVFGEINYQISERLSLSAGLRYTDESKFSTLRHSEVHPFAAGAFGLAPTSLVLEDDFEDSNTSPEVTLTWQANESTIAYVGYRTGYKSGGLSLSSTLVGAAAVVDQSSPGYQALLDSVTYGAEELKGFDAGVKSQLMDGALTLQANVYRYDYDDLQVSAFDAATTSFSISNAATATVQGFELELDYKASDSLAIFAALNYNDATYDNFLSACSPERAATAAGCSADGTQSLAGQAFTLAPEVSANAGFVWSSNLGADKVMAISGSARYSDDYFTQEENAPQSLQDSYTVIDGSLRVSAADDRWSVALIGRNLTEEFYTYSTVPKPLNAFGNQYVAAPERGRQILLEGTFRF